MSIIYKAPAGRVVPHQQCHQWEGQKPLGMGQGDREAGNCCKWGAGKGGAALRKEEEGMKERRRHQRYQDTSLRGLLRQVKALL